MGTNNCVAENNPTSRVALIALFTCGAESFGASTTALMAGGHQSTFEEERAELLAALVESLKQPTDLANEIRREVLLDVLGHLAGGVKTPPIRVQ
jgi:hypothetical protein